MKTIVLPQEEAAEKAAEKIQTLLRHKPQAVLALASGRSVRPLYRALARRCKAGELSFCGVRVFAVTEFEEVPPERSCRRMLEESLLWDIDISPANCVFLTRDNLDVYDAAIEDAGGLDLAVLGLGDNAHIGYNEPAVPFASLSHRQKLTDATRRQNAALFGSEEAAPTYALTMGIHTLVSAREIMVLAFGEEKAEAVHKMLYGRNDSAVPAAFLQIPSEVTIYLDDAAAKKL